MIIMDFLQLATQNYNENAYNSWWMDNSSTATSIAVPTGPCVGGIDGIILWAEGSKLNLPTILYICLTIYLSTYPHVYNFETSITAFNFMTYFINLFFLTTSYKGFFS